MLLLQSALPHPTLIQILLDTTKKSPNDLKSNPTQSNLWISFKVDIMY